MITVIFVFMVFVNVSTLSVPPWYEILELTDHYDIWCEECSIHSKNISAGIPMGDKCLSYFTHLRDTLSNLEKDYDDHSVLLELILSEEFCSLKKEMSEWHEKIPKISSPDYKPKINIASVTTEMPAVPESGILYNYLYNLFACLLSVILTLIVIYYGRKFIRIHAANEGMLMV